MSLFLPALRADFGLTERYQGERMPWNLGHHRQAILRIIAAQITP